MPKGWSKDIEAIVQQGEGKVREAETLRLKREGGRRKAVDAAKDGVRSCLEDAVKIMKEYEVVATLIEDEASIFLKMPELSEVNRADLIFEFECVQRSEQVDAEVAIHSLRIEANAPAKASDLAPGGDVEEFTVSAVKEFLDSWYKRKLSDELNKEREWKLKISWAPLQGKGAK